MIMLYFSDFAILMILTTSLILTISMISMVLVIDDCINFDAFR